MCFSWKEIYVYNIRIIARVWVFKCGQLENDVQWNSSVNWSHSLVFSQLVPAAFSKLSSAKNCCVSVVFNLVTLQQWHIQGSNCVTAPLWSYRKFLDSFCTVFVNIPFCDWTIKSVTRGFCLLKKLHQNIIHPKLSFSTTKNDFSGEWPSPSATPCPVDACSASPSPYWNPKYAIAVQCDAHFYALDICKMLPKCQFMGWPCMPDECENEKTLWMPDVFGKFCGCIVTVLCQMTKLCQMTAIYLWRVA